MAGEKSFYPFSGASGALQIIEITSNDDCFVKGTPYTMRIKFRNIVQRSWKVVLNNEQIHNLGNIVFDHGLIATVTITADLYIGNASYGDIPISINITSGAETKQINKVICVRLRAKQVRVSTVKAARINTEVQFYIYSSGIVGKRSVYLLFRHNSFIKRDDVSSNVLRLRHRYTTQGLVTYKWKVTTKMYVASGTGDINIVWPVGRASQYRFKPIIQKVWPDSRVNFKVTRLCGFNSPTSAFFRLHFGDGDVAQWQRYQPYYGCNRTIELRGHTYEKPGCYKTVFELRNPIGSFTLHGKVRILQNIKSLRIFAHSISPSAHIEKSNLGMKEFYVPDTYPFNVTAIATSLGCGTYEWIILRPYWAKNTSDVNSVIVSHLIKRPGTYDFEVKVHYPGNSMSKRIKIIVSKSLRGLSLLAKNVGRDGEVAFYALVEEQGLLTTLRWKFGDGISETIRNPKFIPAVNLSNIANVPLAKDLDLNKRYGILKEHKYSSDGLYNAIVKVNDTFRTLTAKRTVLISKTHCLRPRVKIATHNDSKKMVFSIGETFTIITTLIIDCEISYQAIFRWTLLRSSLQDMKDNRISESDKAIR